MYFNKNTIIFKNGQWSKATDAVTTDFNQSMHYGNGVFEGIRSYGNAEGCNIFRAHEHFERLIYSARKIHLKVQYTPDELVNVAYQLLSLNNLTDAYIRPLVFSGTHMGLYPSKEANFFMAAWKWEKYLGHKPLDIVVSSFQKPSPRAAIVDAKISGYYANAILATAEAQDLGYDEALFLDINDNVAEAPGANFFYEKDGVLYTPPTDFIFPGITRKAVMELAIELDIPVVEKFFTIDEVYKADTAFFTGTAMEVAQIASVNGHKLSGSWTESMAHQIYQMYRQKVRYNQYQGLTII